MKANRRQEYNGTLLPELVPYMDVKYVTSNYIEGGLTRNIFKIITSTSSNLTAIDNYSQYYSLSSLIDRGINTLKSPHSNKALKIDITLINVLLFFTQPGSIKDYFAVYGFNASNQRLLNVLIKDKFIFPAETDQDRIFNLLNVELDPNTVCNQACGYCPVSIKPRQKMEMSEELFDEILSQVSSLNSGNKISILLNAYNEPTLDKRYPRFVKKIKERGFGHTVVSNGSNLNPLLIDELIGLDVRDYALNIPALDKHEYYKLRGTKDIEKIIRNIDYLAKKQANINILVHGTGNYRHYKNFRDLANRFNDSNIRVSMGRTMDRAGIINNEYRANINRKRLHGCMTLGSRLINWIHINAKGECNICCMDYYQKYKIGDLNKSSISEILSGDNITLYRRYLYGLEDAPEDFICRRCVASDPVSWKDISVKDITGIRYYNSDLRVKLEFKYHAIRFLLPLYLKSLSLRLLSRGVELL